LINKVVAIVSDNIIWNKDQFIIDLVASWQQGPVIVDLKTEGPCCESIGLDNILSHIQDKFKVNFDNLVIHTGNQLRSSKFQEKRIGITEIEKSKEFILYSQSDNFEKKFGLFIGRSNGNRLGLASYLHKNYQSSTLMTFHFDPHSDFHIANLGLENFLRYNWDQRQDTYQFLEHVPIADQKFDSYPILWDKDAFKLHAEYKQIFCDIICETFFTGKTFMPTEKTLRAIANRRPFLVQGPKWYLHNLRKLGFKTFDRWWSEEYDLLESDQKYGELKLVIDYISEQSTDTLKKWYHDMNDVVEHNIHTLQNLNNNMITEIEFHYE
jgi:hypothetical protein